MKNKFSRSVTAIMLTAALLISSQGVVTAFADDGDHSDMSESSSVLVKMPQSKMSLR